MNNRLKELLDQANEQFAMTIVQECAKICEDHSSKVFAENVNQWHDPTEHRVAKMLANKIKQHFMD